MVDTSPPLSCAPQADHATGCTPCCAGDNLTINHLLHSASSTEARLVEIDKMDCNFHHIYQGKTHCQDEVRSQDPVRKLMKLKVIKQCLNIARGTTDPEIASVTWIKFSNNMAPLAFVANLVNRWHNLRLPQVFARNEEARARR